MAVPIAHPLLNATALASVRSLATAFVDQASQELDQLKDLGHTRAFRELGKLIGYVHEGDPHIGGRLGRLFDLYLETLPRTARRHIIPLIEVTLLEITEPLLAEVRRRAGVKTGGVPAAAKIAGGLDLFPPVPDSPLGRFKDKEKKGLPPITGNRSWALGAKEIKLFTEVLRIYQEWERLPYDARVSGTDQLRVIRCDTLHRVLQTGRVGYAYWPGVCKTLLRYFHRQSRNPDATPDRLRQAMKLFLAMEGSLFARKGWTIRTRSGAQDALLSAARRVVLLEYGTRPFARGWPMARWFKGEEVYGQSYLPQEHYRQVGDLLVEGGMDPDEVDELIVNAAREEMWNYADRGLPEGVRAADFEWVILSFGGSEPVDGETLFAAPETPFSRAVEGELRSQVRRVFTTLAWREEQVLRNRFGIDSDEMTLEEIGDALEVTRERARQIESEGLDRLKHPSRAQRLKPFYLPPDNDWPAAVRRY